MLPKGFKVLLVEDDPFHRKDLLNDLKRRNFVVTPARNVREAERALETERFGAAIIDIEIPEDDSNAFYTNDDLKARGLRLGLSIKQQSLPMGVIFRSSFGRHTFWVRQMAAQGYRGIAYVSKMMPFDEMLIVVNRIAVNPSEIFIDPRLDEKLPHSAKALRYLDMAVPKPMQPHVESAYQNIPQLSKTQLRVLEMIADGMMRQSIADMMERELKAVGSHVTAIYHTLFGVRQPDAFGFAKDVVAMHAFRLWELDSELRNEDD